MTLTQLHKLKQSEVESQLEMQGFSLIFLSKVEKHESSNKYTENQEKLPIIS